MPKKAYLILVFFLVAAGISACTPTCDAGSLLQPDLISPDWREVVDWNGIIQTLASRKNTRSSFPNIVIIP